MRLYKVFRGAEWTELDRAGETEGGPDDQRDGFVHFSTREQLGRTLERHFKGETGLVLAACESDEMGEALSWEEGRDGESFPHLHRTLSRDEVVWHTELPRDGIDTMALGDE